MASQIISSTGALYLFYIYLSTYSYPSYLKPKWHRLLRIQFIEFFRFVESRIRDVGEWCEDIVDILDTVDILDSVDMQSVDSDGEQLACGGCGQASSISSQQSAGAPQWTVDTPPPGTN